MDACVHIFEEKGLSVHEVTLQCIHLRSQMRF